MNSSGWRRAAVHILALAALQSATLAGAQSLANPPVRVPLPPPDPGLAAQSAANDDAPSWWTRHIAEPLQELGVESWRDAIRPGTWSGDIGLDFDAQDQRVRSPGRADQRYGTLLFRESFGIRNEGFALLHRNLATGNIGVRLGLQQDRQDTNGIKHSQNGTVLNYSFDTTFLPEHPYNGYLFANQSENTYVLISGGSTESRVRNQGIALRLREDSILREREILPHFTANLRAEQQYNRVHTNVGGQSFDTDDRRDLVSLDFQNGTETSDLDVQYRFTRLDNRAYTLGSYDSQSGSLRYSIDFGPTLNWRWDSQINYYTRSGADPSSDMTSLDLNEYLTIDHRADLFSSYSYMLSRQETLAGTASTQNAVVQVQRTLYGNLMVNGSGIGVHTSLPTGSIASAGAQMNLTYSRRLPWDGQLTAAAGGGYLITDTQVPGGAVQVVDAAYLVPQSVGAGASLLLRDLNVQVPTLVVVVVKSGGTRVTATVDVDYTVTVDGDRTSLVPQPTSATMLPGDLLNVSYTYLVSPSARYQTVSRSASVNAEWEWFGFSFSHDETDQTPLEGSDTSLLTDQRKDAGVVYVRGIWETVQGRLAAGLVRFDSTRLAYEERRLDEYVTYSPYDNLQFTLTGNQYRTEYRAPNYTTTGSAVRLDLSYFSAGWTATGYGAWRSYKDTRSMPETLYEAGLRLRRTWAKLDFGAAAGFQQRTRGDVESRNVVVHVGAIRRF